MQSCCAHTGAHGHTHGGSSSVHTHTHRHLHTCRDTDTGTRCTQTDTRTVRTQRWVRRHKGCSATDPCRSVPKIQPWGNPQHPHLPFPGPRSPHTTSAPSRASHSSRSPMRCLRCLRAVPAPCHLPAWPGPADVRPPGWTVPGAEGEGCRHRIPPRGPLVSGTPVLGEGRRAGTAGLATLRCHLVAPELGGADYQGSPSR